MERINESSFFSDKENDVPDMINYDENHLNNSQIDQDVSYFPDANVSLESERDLNTTLNDTIQLKKNLGETFDQLTKPGQSKPGSFRQSVAEKIHEFEMKPANTLSFDSYESESEPEPKQFSVYLRLRPTANSDNTIEILPKTAVDGRSVQKIRTHAPASSHSFKVARAGGSSILKEFEFAEVFPQDASQEVVYERTVSPYINGVLAGESGLVFCYGITNAGKTYTVTGPDKTLTSDSVNQSWGLLPRALKHLFELCHNNGTQNLSLHMSYFEIYNEKIFDLLSVETMTGRTAAHMKKSLHSISLHRVPSLADGLSFISQAKTNRRCATNSINKESSRSHAICQIQVLNKSSNIKSNLWIVDLAGSERSKRTGGARQQEAANINMSLMTLNQCLEGLRSSAGDKKNAVIPWRDSKLTRLFAAHWMGPYANRTSMVINVNPAASDFDETQHVLSYSSVARNIDTSSIPKEKAAPSVSVEYDNNGHRMVSGKPTFSQKIVNAIKKLSPHRFNGSRKRKENSDDHDAKPSDVFKYPVNNKKIRTEVVEGDEKIAPRGSSSTDQKEINSLRMKVSVLEVENQMLKTQNDELQADVDQLRDQMESVEADVRDEVAEEMESQMRAMSQQYDDIIEKLKLQMEQLVSSGAVASARKLHPSRGEQKIAELTEQLEECEEEMQRMRKDQEEQIAVITAKYEEEVSKKDAELQSLREKLEKVQKENEVNSFAIKVEKGSDALVREEGGCSQGSSPSNPILLDDTQSTFDSFDVEVLDEKNTQQIDIECSPDPAFPLSRKDKNPVRHPFEVLSSNSRSEPQLEDCWMKPNATLKQDPSTGFYLRPKGRKPKDAEYWDKNRGAWRLSVAMNDL
ncbi:kinesin family member 20 [Fistulifera solaris]|jgi:predicted  nucleic acid-binding Zn-ribbon protein|uniref:Kinesin family member 20 n=1 Tax=Fistulifera solaris TaxID=1519565 RepID=A0A1Z5K9A2_FISSO|nr:kinesin family member 20 [Fistulifera solaris]|eukprot:GAX22691.1 kinesin family member 20 [Fistulifera solaris]